MKLLRKSAYRKSLYSLLAGFALFAIPAMESAADAANLQRTIVLAQSTAAPPVDEKSGKRADKDAKAKTKAHVKAESGKPGADMKKARQGGNDKKHADDDRRGKRDMMPRLRIWGSEVRILSGAPALSTQLPCKKLPFFTVFARNSGLPALTNTDKRSDGPVGSNSFSAPISDLRRSLAGR